MQIFHYDENYLYLGEDVIEDFEDIPENATDIQPKGFYLPKFDPGKEEWSESATQEYIDSLQPDPPPPDDVALLKKQVALLTLQLSQLQKGGAS
ncbi:hypothetical protein MH206_08680 [Bacillus altitudinis]|uniref:hypothetical protein n=1 Tax=Bacillus altitudinis TaxID=293387 RepID=UPI00227E7C9C|nr:hypothetical protein [Bacillus altitudinis]MCY7629108.1 hypothetical protein [Bacillus altitudinis]